MTRPPLQSFYLPQKLGGERRFAPETFIAGFAPQALVHVAYFRFKGAPQDTELLSMQFEHHHDTHPVEGKLPDESA